MSLDDSGYEPGQARILRSGGRKRAAASVGGLECASVNRCEWGCRDRVTGTDSVSADKLGCEPNWVPIPWLGGWNRIAAIVEGPGRVGVNLGELWRMRMP